MKAVNARILLNLTNSASQSSNSSLDCRNSRCGSSACSHLRPPELGLRSHELERRRVLGRGPPGGRQQVAIGLVHQDQVGLLNNAPLYGLRKQE